MADMTVEYDLDRWEGWGNGGRSIEIDPEDYRGMADDEIRDAVYAEIRRDAEQNMYFVYAEGDVLAQIKEANTSSEEADDDDN